MTENTFLREMGATLGSGANVKAVYGEPVPAAGRTVIPVAKVSYGFGGGIHSGGVNRQEGEGGVERAGGGGGVRAYPVGALEISATETRLIPIGNWRRIAAAFLGGTLAGFCYGHERKG